MKWFIDGKTASPKQVTEYTGLMLWGYLQKWADIRFRKELRGLGHGPQKETTTS